MNQRQTEDIEPNKKWQYFVWLYCNAYNYNWRLQLTSLCNEKFSFLWKRNQR